ncbi:MAG: RyR domain-containing protein [Armatimonadota bacterium]|nr:RyR domain-containing protein [Armatimonadota bacterium]
MTSKSAKGKGAALEVIPYTPAPHDTSGVRLTREMSALTEELAKNTHEVWAAQRMAEGWRCGPCRDEERKEHPGLVPYEHLPDSEKEYDRSTALETLRLILSLGYYIEKNSLS